MIARAASPLVWLAGLLGLYLLGPIAAYLVRLAGSGAKATPGLGSALEMSALTASISAAVIALLGVPLAYLLARGRGRTSRTLYVLVALPLALPPLMSGILLVYVVGPYSTLGRLFNGALTDSVTGIVLAQVFVAAPFLIVAARAAFAAVDPALEDVAATLGHGRLARFVRVALPAAAPGIGAGVLLAWLRAFGEFGATVILAYHPYSLPVYTFVQFNSAGVTGTLAPVGVALGAAVVVLAAAEIRAHRPRRPRARIPAATPPTPRPAGPLAFALNRRLGEFALDIAHTAKTRQLALLGPSGAGKTLALRLIAGLERPDGGSVRAADQDLSALAAEHRSVGYVPQSVSLLPRRTVWQQVTFGADADPALAAWWLDRLRLHGLEDRYPHELSGGQQRRVAVARALACNPRLLLLDEPFAGLDAPVRDRLRRDLRRLQQEEHLATVLVTHDPEDAALLSQETIVIADGALLQAGPSSEVLAAPASRRVAALIGIPNALPGRVVARGRLATAGLRLAAPTGALEPGAAVTWGIRPEHVRVADDGDHRVGVVDLIDLGGARELTLRVGADLELVARVLASVGELPSVGETCRIDLPRDAITVWPEPGEADPAQSGTPIITSEALTTTTTSWPSDNPSSSTASTVIEATRR